MTPPAVLDRPLPPRNVVVSDIKADSCYLTWDAPEDNGGSDITNYIVEHRDASKKKSDFEVLTTNIIDRRYGVSLQSAAPDPSEVQNQRAARTWWSRCSAGHQYDTYRKSTRQEVNKIRVRNRSKSSSHKGGEGGERVKPEE